MGMGNAQQQNQVYFDNGGYYTQTPLSMANPVSARKTYIDALNKVTTTQQVSPLNDLLAKAMAAKANAPTLQSLFPNMGNQSMMNYQAPMQAPMVNPMAGQYGAGRFLGNNSMSSGMTSNAMNTM